MQYNFFLSQGESNEFPKLVYVWPFSPYFGAYYSMSMKNFTIWEDYHIEDIKFLRKLQTKLCIFFRISGKFGLPDNQRILDPKKGPVKKTAAVRKLPKLNKSMNGSR